METQINILTLDKCRAFINDCIEPDDYEILSALCNFPASTIRKYVKEGVPNTSAARILANRIVVHSIDIIRKKANSKLESLNNLIKDYELPDLTA